MIHLAQDLNLILQLIESPELGYVDGLASEGLVSGAMDAFADAGEISRADDAGKDDIIVEHVGSYCDGLMGGLMVFFWVVVQCTMFEDFLDIADLLVETIIAVVNVSWMGAAAISSRGCVADFAHDWHLD